MKEIDNRRGGSDKKRKDKVEDTGPLVVTWAMTVKRDKVRQRRRGGESRRKRSLSGLGV